MTREGIVVTHMGGRRAALNMLVARCARGPPRPADGRSREPNDHTTTPTTPTTQTTAPGTAGRRPEGGPS